MTCVLVTSTVVIVADVLSGGIVVNVFVSSVVEIAETTARAAICIYAGRNPIQGLHFWLAICLGRRTIASSEWSFA
jgi:hypothetical protein